MLRFIPLVAQAGITGFESPAAEYTELGISLDQLLVEHPSATYIGFASGESMQGAGIFDGDLLVVSRAETVKDMDVIVGTLNGVFVCKQVDKKRGALISANPGFKTYQLNDGDSFSVEGVVTRSIRLHRPIHTLSDVRAC